MKRTKKIHRQKNEQGFALVTTLLFLTVMGLLSTTLVFTVQNEMQSSASYKYSQQAFYVADAGVQKAVYWYRNSYDPLTAATGAGSYDTTEYPVEINSMPVMLAGQAGSTSTFPDTSSIASFFNEFNNKTLAANQKNTGTYAVNATLLKYESASFIDPNTFVQYQSAVERWRIDSIGYWGNANNPIGVSRIEAVIENSGNALFDRALWGIDGVDLGGTVRVDSYDPEIGHYDPITNAGSEGHVGSNASVSAVGTVDIMGDLAYGPTGSFSGGPNITVAGDILQLPQERIFPPIPNFTIPAGSPDLKPKNTTITINPGTYGTIDIMNNGILELNPGVYYIDSLQQAALGALKISGDTTIYVKSGLDLSGQGVINPMGDPTELTIYYDGVSEAKFTGGSSAYMEVYAPEAPVTLTGNADFFGSFIGKTLELTGTPEVHFSLGCLDDNLMEQPFRILSWSQKSF
ncbi:MAG: pilus assembly PilX N-terminal domain-containing protein [Acidobacteria bacterium]|nr:pilus assembly PilX N-terminal domain-containing protein [Acidobacteriota bacterium]